jgi:hypothetical protein
VADRRAVATTAGVILGGAALLWLMIPLMRADLAEEDLRDRCARVSVGDPVAAAYAELGREGYRKGCGHVTPCERLDLGGTLGSFEWLCDLEDCSQLWRSGDAACTVDIDPATRRVRAVDLADWDADGF